LFPIAVTVYVTWWFLDFFDSFFSPLYKKLIGIEVFGLGFVTSMVFILLTGQATHSSLPKQTAVYRRVHVILGWRISAVDRRVGDQATPLSEKHLLGLEASSHIGTPSIIFYPLSFCPQVSAALNPDNEAARAFKECVLIKHPRNGEFAFGFITGETWIDVRPSFEDLFTCWS